MFEVEYGCDVQNKFKDCAEASDPFELLSAKSKTGGKKSAAAKRVPKSTGSTGAKVAVDVKPPAPKQEQQQLVKEAPERVSQAKAPAPEAAKPLQAGATVESAEVARPPRGRGTNGPRRRMVDGRVSYDTVTFRRGGRGARYEGTRSSFAPRPPVAQTEQQQQAYNEFTTEPTGIGNMALEELPRRPYRGRFGRFGVAGTEGRRQFDRHSGSVRTGVRAEEKRRGAGAHNWGKASEVMDPTGADYEQVETSVTEQPVATDENIAPDDAIERKSRSPSPVQMTLDEYREQQRRQKIEHKPEGRKAGEGEDPKRWAKPALVYHKKPDENLKYAKQEKYRDTSEDEASEEDETDEEDERTKLEKTVTSSMFVAKPAVIGGTGGRRGRFEGYRDENRAEQQSGKTSRGLPQLEVRRGGGRGQRATNTYERRQQQQQQQQQNAEKPPDLSEFPELC